MVDGSEHFLAITLPARDDPLYPAAADLLRSAGFVLEPSNRKWWLRDRHKTLSFLAAHGERLRREFGARFTPNFVERTARLADAEMTCEAAASGRGLGRDARAARRLGRGKCDPGGARLGAALCRGGRAGDPDRPRPPQAPGGGPAGPRRRRPGRRVDAAHRPRGPGAGRRGRGAAGEPGARLPAAGGMARPHRRPARPLEAGAGARAGRPRGRASALPAGRGGVALAPLPPRPRRNPRRRDGARQDAAGPGAARRRAHPRRIEPRRLPRLAGRKLAARGGALRARAHRLPAPRRKPPRGARPSSRPGTWSSPRTAPWRATASFSRRSTSPVSSATRPSTRRTGSRRTRSPCAP